MAEKSHLIKQHRTFLEEFGKAEGNILMLLSGTEVSFEAGLLPCHPHIPQGRF